VTALAGRRELVGAGGRRVAVLEPKLEMFI
jgi:hypothetical protein